MEGILSALNQRMVFAYSGTARRKSALLSIHIADAAHVFDAVNANEKSAVLPVHLVHMKANEDMQPER